MRVTNEVRFTGETIYEVRDGHKLAARVTSDGFFDRDNFHGHVQRPDDSVVMFTSALYRIALDAVQRYIESK